MSAPSVHCLQGLALGWHSLNIGTEAYKQVCQQGCGEDFMKAFGFRCAVRIKSESHLMEKTDSLGRKVRFILSWGSSWKEEAIPSPASCGWEH